jgi:hypothetical protein
VHKQAKRECGKSHPKLDSLLSAARPRRRSIWCSRRASDCNRCDGFLTDEKVGECQMRRREGEKPGELPVQAPVKSSCFQPQQRQGAGSRNFGDADRPRRRCDRMIVSCGTGSKGGGTEDAGRSSAALSIPDDLLRRSKPRLSATAQKLPSRAILRPRGYARGPDRSEADCQSYRSQRSCQ